MSLRFRQVQLCLPLLVGLSVFDASAQADCRGDGMMSRMMSGLSSMFDSKGREFEGLVVGKQFGEAENFYFQHEKDLKKGSQTDCLLKLLSAGLNDQYLPDVEVASAKLPATAASVRWEDWPSFEQAMIQTKAAADRYNTSALLSFEAYRSPKVSVAEANVVRLRGELEKELAQTFADYPHISAPLFKDQHPLKPNPETMQSLTRANVALLTKAATQAEDAQAAKLIDYYGALMEDADRVAMSKAVALAANVRLLEALWVGADLRKAGVSGEDLLHRIQAFVLEPPTGAKTWAPPQGVATELLALDELEDIIAFANEYPAGFILVDAHRTATFGSIAVASNASARYASGQREEFNPRYAEAQQEVTNAEQELNTARQQQQLMQAQINQLQSNSMASRFISALGSGTSAVAVTSAQERVRNAYTALNNTPRTVMSTTYAPYNVPVARLTVERVEELAAYVVMPHRGEFYKVTVRRNPKQEADLALGLHPADPEKDAADGRNQRARTTLAQFTQSGGPIESGELLRALREQPAQLQPLEALVDTIRADQLAWHGQLDDEERNLKERSTRLEMELRTMLGAPSGGQIVAAMWQPGAAESEPAFGNFLDALSASFGAARMATVTPGSVQSLNLPPQQAAGPASQPQNCASGSVPIAGNCFAIGNLFQQRRGGGAAAFVPAVAPAAVPAAQFRPISQPAPAAMQLRPPSPPVPHPAPAPVRGER